MALKKNIRLLLLLFLVPILIGLTGCPGNPRPQTKGLVGSWAPLNDEFFILKFNADHTVVIQNFRPIHNDSVQTLPNSNQPTHEIPISPDRQGSVIPVNPDRANQSQASVGQSKATNPVSEETYKYEYDASKKPAWLDLVELNAANPRRVEGLVVFNGANEIQICFGEYNQARPASVTARESYMLRRLAQ